MINIVHINTHCNDDRKITKIEVKLKSINDLSGHPLLATISAAFFKTTLLTDAGDALQILPNLDRKDIVNLEVSIKDNLNLSFEDIARFLEAFQEAIDRTTITF